MKRIISFILATIMILSISVTVFAADFSDLNSSHWAHQYVSVLVNDGTINGFPDGSFKPSATVTRAQFVKMIGFGPETRTEEFDDVKSSHWAYKYVMTSGLDAAKDNMFMPDTPITRGEVANLLWKRAGSPMGITAPPVIHRQGTNYDAISWVYTNGIMVGDDYIDLRLGDTLTRAEASALIVRSRNVTASTSKTNFMNSVDEGIYKAVYNAFKITDNAYDANATITNGELAMLAARLHCGEDIPTYPNISAEITFEHKYAQPINMLCRYYLGMENDNAAYADKKSSVKEAVAALMFATSRSAGVYIPMGTDAAYPQYKSNGNAKFDQLIKNAYHNGIWFTTADEMNLDKEITMKELACLVLQFDGFSGFHRISVITPEKTSLKNQKIKSGFESYPKNQEDYRIVLENVPNYVYEKPFAKSVSLPKDTYVFMSSYRAIPISMLSGWVRALGSVNYKLEVSYYPGLSVDNGNGYTMRVGIRFADIPSNTKLGDIVNCVNANDGATIVNSGDNIYVDIDTGKKISGLVMGIDDMVLSQIIR